MTAHPMQPVVFGATLRAAREAADLSPTDVAPHAGYIPRLYESVEAGEAIVMDANVPKLAAFLGLDAAALDALHRAAAVEHYRAGLERSEQWVERQMAEGKLSSADAAVDKWVRGYRERLAAAERAVGT